MPTSSNTTFSSFAGYLLELHRLIAAGRGDDADADAIRDSMDVVSKSLPSADDLLFRGLSADLYTLGQPADNLPRVDAQAVAAIKVAENKEDWAGLLVLLREFRGRLAPHYVQFMRAVCWAHLQQFEVAIVFLRDSLRIVPDEPTILSWLLLMLLKASRIDEAVTVAKECLTRSFDASVMLRSVVVLFVAAEQSDASNSAEMHRLAIQWADRTIVAAETSKNLETIRHSLGSVYLHKSLSHDLLGQQELALQACQKAILYYPREKSLQLLQGWLRRNEPQGQDAFRRNLTQCFSTGDFFTQTLEFDTATNLTVLH